MTKFDKVSEDMSNKESVEIDLEHEKSSCEDLNREVEALQNAYREREKFHTKLFDERMKFIIAEEMREIETNREGLERIIRENIKEREKIRLYLKTHPE